MPKRRLQGGNSLDYQLMFLGDVDTGGDGSTMEDGYTLTWNEAQERFLPTSMPDAASTFGVMNVKEFGAVGDGVTDDTAAIQDALAATDPDGGGVVYFPPGIYIISQTLKIPNKTTVYGAGRQNTSVIRANLAGLLMLESKSNDTASDTHYIVIRDLMVDGNDLASIGMTIGNDSALSFYNTIERVDVVNCDNGILMNYAINSSIVDCHLHGRDVVETTGLYTSALTQGLYLRDVFTDAFEVNWYFQGTGIVAVSCASFSEATDENAVNLLKLIDAYQNLFTECVFENFEGSSVATEVYLLESNTPNLHTSENTFLKCRWNGTNPLTYRVQLGSGDSTVYKTHFIECTFLHTGSTDINYVHSEDTLVKYCNHITSYSGTEVSGVTSTGTDVGDPPPSDALDKLTVLAGNLFQRNLDHSAYVAIPFNRRVTNVADGAQINLLDVSGFGIGTMGMVIISSVQDGTIAMYAVTGGNQQALEVFDPYSDFTNVKDSAGKTNLYYDSGAYKVQNMKGTPRTYYIHQLVDTA